MFDCITSAHCSGLIMAVTMRDHFTPCGHNRGPYMKPNATKLNSGQVYILSVFLDTCLDSWELVVKICGLVQPGCFNLKRPPQEPQR